MLNSLGDNIANIGRKLANVILDRVDIDSIENRLQLALNMDNDGITSAEFTENDLLKAIKLINPMKSSAVENIRASVIIDAFEFILDRFLRLFNSSIRKSIFPQKWKVSIVVPLPKTAAPTVASDMRPISLIPLPGKILEHLISMRLKVYLDNNNILAANQHGFRKGHSTITAINTLLNDIYKNVNSLSETYLVYLDLKKAFDTVSHKILLNKLCGYGFDQRTISWFSSYLNGRSQLVKFNNINSSRKDISYGVPQGSILGPTLFSLYINDITELFPRDCIILYADDTVLYGKDPGVIDEMLTKTYMWCEKNLLTINCKKSQWMSTSILSKCRTDTTFKLGKVILDRVNEYRYLGVLMDSDLNFQQHREAVQKRLNLKNCFFRKIRKYITIEAALTIYKSTILPIIEYADFVYDHNINYVSKKFQTYQNQGLYTVYNNYFLPYPQRDSTETLHRRAKLYRLKHRRRLHLLSYAYALSKKDNLLDKRDIHTRRHQGKLFITYKLNHFKCLQDPMYRAMHEWNNLNVITRNAATKTIFLNCIKAEIVNPYSKII